MQEVKLVDLRADRVQDYGLCSYKDVKKHRELQRKITWMEKYQPLGLRVKILDAGEDGSQGMIEYIPGKYAHRPVDAAEFTFIHCIAVGYKKEYKRHGLGSMLLEACIDDAKAEGLKGVAVVTRKGSFMADKHLFLKAGFEVVDTLAPDFSLLALKFDRTTANPRFKKENKENLKQYAEGLTIMRSAQCPYTVKNVEKIMKTAEEMGMSVNLIEMDDHALVQSVPCAFGVFCLMHEGEVISHHPISGTRFGNIIRERIQRECD